MRQAYSEAERDVVEEFEVEELLMVRVLARSLEYKELTPNSGYFSIYVYSWIPNREVQRLVNAPGHVGRSG